MRDFANISWQATESDDGLGSNTENQVEALVEWCTKQIPQKALLKSCETIVEERVHLREVFKNIIEKIAEQPLLAAFIVWIKEIAFRDTGMMNASKMLLESHYIGMTDDTGKVWTISNARGFDHRTVIDSIRCQREWSLQTRELVVYTYLSFLVWLSQETRGYIARVEDPDRERVKGRVLDYPLFIKFIDALSGREQLVAKLLYYGGRRTLDEVLSIQIEDVDFEKRAIHYPSEMVIYPMHVFSDIKVLIEKRESGKIFVGRKNTSLN
ncbi:MAG: hypothetical protein JWO53_707, partial [Chlamydiia bacterium]|nr:hypothetical protein [Chlamydiia bacterium]